MNFDYDVAASSRLLSFVGHSPNVGSFSVLPDIKYSSACRHYFASREHIKFQMCHLVAEADFVGVLSDLLGSIGNSVQEHAPVILEAFGRDRLLQASCPFLQPLQSPLLQSHLYIPVYHQMPQTNRPLWSQTCCTRVCARSFSMILVSFWRLFFLPGVVSSICCQEARS